MSKAHGSFRHRSFEVEEKVINGRLRYLTILRVDGFWFQTLIAKNRRSAERKGRDHVERRRSWDTYHERRAAKERLGGKAKILGIGLGLHQ